MSSQSSYRYREESRGWGNNPRNATRRDTLHMQLMRTVRQPVKPAAPNDIANWKGKNVWGIFNGTRQLLHVMSLAPEGKEGERWYVLPAASSKLLIMSVSKRALELSSQIKSCTALAIRPPMAIVVYVGVQ